MNAAAYWTQVALDANRRDFTPPPGGPGPQQGGPTLSSRALALVHLAMHDAYFSKIGTHPTWIAGLAAPDNDAPEGSMAAAAEAVLRALYRRPDHVVAIDRAVQAFIPVIPVPGHAVAWGKEVAQKVLDSRLGDLAYIGQAHSPSLDRYRHRPDPFNPGQDLHGQLWGKCTPFAVPCQPLAAPPHWSNKAGQPDAHYQADFDEVRDVGGLASSERTADHTVQGIYWAYDGAHGIGTPPRLYCQIALKILTAIATKCPDKVDTADHVRLFALITTAMADAGIQAWHWKYHYDLWRPVVGIREADDCTGPTATPGKIQQSRTDWGPLGAPATNRGMRFTPGFPAYPSGHATFAAAAFQVLRLYLEQRALVDYAAPGELDCVGFDFESDEFNGKNTDPDGSRRPRHWRSFTSLWDAIVENAESRVYLGVHWRFDGISVKDPLGKAKSGRPAKPSELGPVGGVSLGMAIADKLMAGGLKQP